MKLSTLQSPKDEKIDKKSEIIKIELQKYRMLKAKTAAVKENDTPAPNNESLSDSKNLSMLNRNRISVAELLSPQTYQNLLLVKDDVFKRPKTPEKALPTKKATPDKENYFTPTLSTLVASVSNSKLRTQEAKSPENRFTHDFNPKSCQSSIMRDYDDRQSLGSHEERFASRQERKSTTPLVPKSINRPQSSHANNVKQRQSAKTPEKIMLKYQSNKKPLSDSKALNSNAQVNDFEEARSPSVKKSIMNKSRDVENSYEALADLKRQLSKKKLAFEYEQPEEEPSRIKKQNPYKRAGTPDNHSRRESIDMNNSKLGTSSSKSNLHSTIAKESGNDKALLDEIEKWKKFGKMMADSYEELNTKFQNFMKESEKDKKVIEALKEQVTKLKSLIKLQNDSSITQENSRKAPSSYQKKSSRQSKESERDEEDDDTEFLKNENKSLRKTVEELTKYAEESEYYKKLAESKFRECSALAEEIICLRTDLDRSNSNYLRIQRQHGSGSKGGSIVSEQSRINNNTKGYADYSAEQERYGFATRLRESRREEDEASQDEREDEPPLPQKFTIRPARDERTGL